MRVQIIETPYGNRVLSTVYGKTGDFIVSSCPELVVRAREIRNAREEGSFVAEQAA